MDTYSNKFDNLVIGVDDDRIDIDATDAKIQKYYDERLAAEIAIYGDGEDQFHYAKQDAWDQTMDVLESLIVYEE